MWGVFKVRKEPRPSRWGSFAVKKTIQKGGKSVVITPTQAEVEKAKALVKKKPQQRGNAPVNVPPHPTPRGEGWGFLTFSKMSCQNPHMVQKIQCQNNKHDMIEKRNNPRNEE